MTNGYQFSPPLATSANSQIETGRGKSRTSSARSRRWKSTNVQRSTFNAQLSRMPGPASLPVVLLGCGGCEDRMKQGSQDKVSVEFRGKIQRRTFGFSGQVQLIAVLILLAATVFGADNIPYGHRNFRPTPERPIGWRGDGSGLFPGACPVLEWDDPTVASPTRNSSSDSDVDLDKVKGVTDGEAKKADDGEVAAARGKNIIWKVKLPDFGHCAPIVVGDSTVGSGYGRVFVTAERDRLICLDAGNGKILWQDNPHMDQRPGAWGDSLGRAMPTPCSDGKTVYTKCTTGALIAYDVVTGAKKWSFPLMNNQSETYISSPTLVDGKVIVKEIIGGKVYAVDAATGKAVWTIDLSGKKVMDELVAANFEAYAVMRVGGRTLLVDAGGHVLDAANGEIVANGLAKHGDKLDLWNGMMHSSLPGSGDVNIFAHSWRWAGFKGGHTATYLNGSTHVYAYRFSQKAGGKGLGTELLWESNRDFWGSGRGTMIVGDRCYWVSKNLDELTVIDMKTGDARTFAWLFGYWKHTSVTGRAPYGWVYPHSVSDGYFLFQQGGSGLMAVALLAPVPRFITINKTAYGFGGPTLHGDRVYIHSCDYLYCIGDVEAEKVTVKIEEAETLHAAGKNDQAFALLVEAAKYPAPHVRCRAIHLMLEWQGVKAIKDVAVVLGDSNPWVNWLAVEAARRLNSAKLVDAVTAALPDAKPAAKATLLQMLAVRGESAAAATILAGLTDGADVVRKAALAAAHSVGAAAVARGIVARYPDAEQWERRHMFAALEAMPGDEVDSALAAALGSASGMVRADAAALLGIRGAVQQKQAVLAMRNDSDAGVRASAAHALRGLVAADDMDALHGWMLDAQTREEEDALVEAAGVLMKQHPAPDTIVVKIQALWPNAKSGRKRCLLAKVLGKRHVSATLNALKGLLTSEANADVAVATLGELGAWSSADARPILADMLKAGQPERVRRAAYMGYVRSVGAHESNIDSQIELLKKAVPLAPRPGDRNSVFETCVKLRDIRALCVVSGAIAKEMGGPEAVSALTRLAPLMLEKEYRKTMACVKEAMSAVDFFQGKNTADRDAQKASLKECLAGLQKLAAEKNLVSVGETEDIDVTADIGL